MSILHSIRVVLLTPNTRLLLTEVANGIPPLPGGCTGVRDCSRYGNSQGPGCCTVVATASDLDTVMGHNAVATAPDIDTVMGHNAVATAPDIDTAMGQAVLPV